MTNLLTTELQEESQKRERAIDVAVCAVVFVSTVVALSVTAQDVGFTRDEGYYFKAAQLYWGWFREFATFFSDGEPFRAFEKTVIDRHWSYNHEHPVLVKTTFALSYGLLYETFGVFELASNALRFPAWCFAGLTSALIYGFARFLDVKRSFSLLAVLAWLSMPHAYWHMHLSCFDIPVCAAHLWLVFAYARHRHSLMGALVVGVAFGLAAAVKHNVLIAPAIFVLHWLLTEAKRGRFSRRGIQLPAVPLVFFSLAVVGPIVFFLHWPYLWPDLLPRLGFYLGFHLNHEHYPILFFGDLLSEPPFPISFPFVMSAVTVPAPVLALMLMGAMHASANSIRAVLRRSAPSSTTNDQNQLLLLLNAMYPFVLIALPSSPIFGGTKHWMNALPFLCILGAQVLQHAVECLSSSWTRPMRAAVVTMLLVAVALPGVLLTKRIHPYGLASYNSVVGFARGAANVGFQRTFWGYEPRTFLPLINERTPKRGSILFGDTNRDDHAMYRKDKLLREDIGLTGSPSASAVSCVQPQGEFKDQYTKTLDAYGVNGPDAVIHLDGVPVGAITFRPDKSAP